VFNVVIWTKLGINLFGHKDFVGTSLANECQQKVEVSLMGMLGNFCVGEFFRLRIRPSKQKCATKCSSLEKSSPTTIFCLKTFWIFP